MHRIPWNKLDIRIGNTHEKNQRVSGQPVCNPQTAVGLLNNEQRQLIPRFSHEEIGVATVTQSIVARKCGRSPPPKIEFPACKASSNSLA